MKNVWFTLLALTVMSTAFAQDDMMVDQKTERIAVTITNNTAAQVFSPPLLLNHSSDYALFNIGEAAPSELIPLAEDGNASDIITIANIMPEIYAAALADGPLPPGQSVTLELVVNPDFHYLTVAGMLVTTNDAFFGLETPIFGDMMEDEMMEDEMMGDTSEGEMMADTSDDSMMEDAAMKSDEMMTDETTMADSSEEMMADNMEEGEMMGDDMMAMPHSKAELHVYDAGSEANTELCAEIPGPPCGSGGVRHTAMAEGVVDFHQGILGGGDLDSSYNWDSPVATITIERLP